MLERGSRYVVGLQICFKSFFFVNNKCILAGMQDVLRLPSLNGSERGFVKHR